MYIFDMLVLGPVAKTDMGAKAEMSLHIGVPWGVGAKARQASLCASTKATLTNVFDFVDNNM